MRPYCRVSVAGNGYFLCVVKKANDFGQQYQTRYLTRCGGDLKPDWSYNPFECLPALYRTFAQTIPTEQEIVSFTNHFGPLGIEEQFVEHAGGKLWIGEPLDAWLREWKALGDAVRLFDCVRSRKARRIAITFREVVTKETAEQLDADLQAEALSLSSEPDMVDLVSVRPVTELAMCWLGLRVAERIGGSLRSELVWDSQRQHLVLRIVPGNLLQAIWLQFAEALDKRRNNAVCGHCGLRFVAQSSKGKYCSVRCQVAAWRLAKTS